MQQKRLLHVIKGLDFGGIDGGAEQFGAALTIEMSKNSQVDLCIFWQRNTSVEKEWLVKLQDSNLDFFFASNWKRKYHLASYLDGFRSIIHRYPPHSLDIAHSHFQVGSIAVLLLKVLGKTKKIARTAHIAKEWGTGWADHLYRLIFSNWIFPGLFDKEVGVSPAIVEQLRQRSASKLLHRQPVYIPTAILLAEPKRPTKAHDWREILPEGLRLIGSVGRLTEQKDYKTLLEAFALVQKDVSNLCLVIVGDGELRSSLEAQAKDLKIDPHILFLGTQPDAAQIMREFDLFVLPSRWEGLPLVILESMEAGTPIIATDIPGTRDLIQNNLTGRLVPPGNPSAMAEAIKRALNEPAEGLKYAMEAKYRVKAFSMQNIATQYSQLYDTLIE